VYIAESLLENFVEEEATLTLWGDVAASAAFREGPKTYI
jgi:hypothetical protein